MKKTVPSQSGRPAFVDEAILLMGEETKPNATTMLTALRLQPKILKYRCDIQSELAKEKNRLRMPKDKEYTDFDREIMLNDAVRELQALYELLKGLETQLSQFIEILRFNKWQPINCQKIRTICKECGGTYEGNNFCCDTTDFMTDNR